MPNQYSHSLGDSRPAVHESRSTGTSASDGGEVLDLNRNAESVDVRQQHASGTQPSDVNQTAASHGFDTQQDTPLRVGRILLVLPYVHCYRVQITGQQGVCVGIAVSHHATGPLGVRDGNTLAPGAIVLLWKPKSENVAYIICSLPSETYLDEFNPSDLVQQGGNSGPKKVPAMRNIPKAASAGHGWVPQSSGRPMDGTSTEYSRFSETGIGIFIDSFQAYLRVNEACGIFLNYFDNYAKLVATALDIQSFCEHLLQRNDSGENVTINGYSTYPWEATGMYDSGQKFSQEYPADQVQLDRESPYGTQDMPEDATDQTPIYRLTEYRGYLGQGFLRTMMCPAKESGRRLMGDADKDKDVGLFRESLTLDGSYGLESAKQVLLAKYPTIPSARRKRAPEDAKGDDLEEEPNYKFSGKFGDGPDHVVDEFTDNGVDRYPFLLRPAGVMDLFARHFNWKATHAFHYHVKDYVLPEESESEKLGPVEFKRGMKAESFAPVQPVRVKIDDRYGRVNYYNTASLVALTEDGSIVIADGFSSQILLSGGQVKVESTGDMILTSAARVVTLADEFIVRAKGNVDVSSTEKELRLKSEKNMQILAANSGSGGLLIESKGQGIQQDYEDKIGEEVRASGIAMLSRGGSFNVMTQYIYLRSGVEENNPEGNGQIILDSANGRSAVVSYGSIHGSFNSNGFGIWHSPIGQEQIQIEEGHFFSPSFSYINGPTVLKHSTVVDEGHLGVEKNIYCEGHIIALKKLAQEGGGPVSDSSKNELPAQVVKFIDDFAALEDTVKEIGQKLFDANYPEFIWKPKYPGNTELLQDQIGFSFRDLSSKSKNVYGYSEDGFWLLETRWQQLAKFGMISPGPVFKEKPVIYQGNELYPWPGKFNWVDEQRFLHYAGSGGSYILFDSQGYAKDRAANQEDYEKPEWTDWEKMTCDSEYTL